MRYAIMRRLTARVLIVNKRFLQYAHARGKQIAKHRKYSSRAYMASTSRSHRGISFCQQKYAGCSLLIFKCLDLARLSVELWLGV